MSLSAGDPTVLMTRRAPWSDVVLEHNGYASMTSIFAAILPHAAPVVAMMSGTEARVNSASFGCYGMHLATVGQATITTIEE